MQGANIDKKKMKKKIMAELHSMMRTGFNIKARRI